MIPRPPVRIVHLGLGAFFRAHGCAYLQDLNDQGAHWGVLGVSLRSPAVRDAMRARDYRYTAAALTPDGMDLRDIDVVRDVLVAPDDPTAVIAAMADPAVTLVTLTVTEKGYCHDPATGALKLTHPDILADIESPLPVSAPGVLVRALQARRVKGLPPFTVLSCDNLPDNGAVARAVTITLAQKIDPDLAAWIDANTAFPSTMVDRIVPATTPNDIAQIEAQSGQPDGAPVLHEPFTQWVITDEFTGDLPDLAAAGAQIVPDIAPFEQMKLRMLNGVHSALAYLGPLARFKTVSEAVTNESIAAYLRHLWRAEIIPTLTPPKDINLIAYADALLDRFANTGIQHHLSQIAMDGSQKLPQRLLGTLDDRLSNGDDVDALLLAVAGWIATTANQKDADDPMASILRGCHTCDSIRTVARHVSQTAIFDPRLATLIEEPLSQAYARLLQNGVGNEVNRFGS